MNTITEHSEYFKNAALAAWLLIALILLAGSRYLQELAAWLLAKLYEIFIGSKNHLAPY